MTQILTENRDLLQDMIEDEGKDKDRWVLLWSQYKRFCLPFRYQTLFYNINSKFPQNRVVNNINCIFYLYHILTNEVNTKNIIAFKALFYDLKFFQ